MNVLPIPSAALDDRLGFVGTSGSGKTYGAGVGVEALLARKRRVVIVDPLGVWWGLRLAVDGRQKGFGVVILGGARGDLPIGEHAGAIVGETVAGMAESAIVDLSLLGTRAAERRFMLAFLTALHRKASGEPLHLVLDEADLWAPQQIRDREQEPAKLLGVMETIVRRGRVKGFIPWLITQRPAVVNKDVLSQVDGLIAFKLTSSQDRKALGDWIEGQADREAGKSILASLPAMERGRAVVWIPGRGVLATERFPAKATFDSSRTPKPGEKAAGVELKPVDLGALRGRLAAVEAETKANDPRALKARIAELEKAGAAPDNAAIAAAERRGADAERTRLVGELASAEARIRGDAADGLAARVGILEGLAHKLREMAKLVDQESAAAAAAEKSLRRGTGGGLLAKKRVPATVDGSPEKPIRGQPAPPPPAATEGRKSDAAGDVTGPLQRILDAIAWWNVLGVRAPSQPQAAFVAGYSHKSGTWRTYLSRLRSLGLIEGRDLVLTPAGEATSTPPATPPGGEALRRIVLERIDAPLVRILSPLIEAYPEERTHETIAASAGYSPASGTWRTYLSRLRSLDLIEGRGGLKAQDWLFP